MNYFDQIYDKKITWKFNKWNNKKYLPKSNRKAAKLYLITAESTLNSFLLHFPLQIVYLVLLLNNFSTCQFPLIRFSICEKRERKVGFLVVFLLIFPANRKVFPSFSILAFELNVDKRNTNNGESIRLRKFSFQIAFRVKEGGGRAFGGLGKGNNKKRNRKVWKSETKQKIKLSLFH